MSQLATTSRPGQRAAVTNARRVSVDHSRVHCQLWPVLWLEAVSRARPEAARGTQRSEYRTGGGRGRSRTLDADGSHRAYRQGGRTRATPAAPAPADSRARTDAGCNPKGVAQAKRGGFPAGDRLARSRQIRCHQKKPRRSGVDECSLPITGRILSRPAPYPNFCPCSA
jgi:hypothetical protein